MPIRPENKARSMSAVPWLKFFPSNWRSDPALRSCSIGARGLWMEMICIMHEAEPRGSLRINGVPVTAKQLAALAGIRQKECEKLLAELENSGVFSRENDGEIYSRRMRRETEKALKDKENGKQGGNPALKAGVNPQDKAHIPEARSQKIEPEEEKKDSSLRSLVRVDNDWPKDFRERVWQAYPRKIGKYAAFRKLEAIRKSGSVTFAKLMAGLERYAAATRNTEIRYIAHPATWLGQGRWEDEPVAIAQGPPRAQPQSFASLFSEMESQNHDERPDDPPLEYDLDLRPN